MTRAKGVTGKRLTGREYLFVQEYLVDLKMGEAAKRAGYDPRYASQTGYDVMRRPHVSAAIQEAMEARSERTRITADMVLQRWWDIATADPNELVQFRRICCRHCHGEGFAYQWRDKEEYQTTWCDRYEAGEAVPSDDGGYGFDKSAEPNPDCPHCSGEGQAVVFGLDTRALSAPARALYAGAKLTQSGFEIKTQDQGKALENVARHLGMFKNDAAMVNLNVGVGLEHFYGGGEHSEPSQD